VLNPTQIEKDKDLPHTSSHKAFKIFRMKLDDILKERIVILDGAMGTMIQKHNLQEEDYRGERFKDFHTSLKGNNDLLVLTQPQIRFNRNKYVQCQYYFYG